MNPARVIFIDTRHSLPSWSLRFVSPWIVSYRFVSLRFDNASDFRWSAFSSFSVSFSLRSPSPSDRLPSVNSLIVFYGRSACYSLYSIFFTPIRRLLSSWTDAHTHVRSRCAATRQLDRPLNPRLYRNFSFLLSFATSLPRFCWKNEGSIVSSVHRARSPAGKQRKRYPTCVVWKSEISMVRRKLSTSRWSKPSSWITRKK